MPRRGFLISVISVALALCSVPELVLGASIGAGTDSLASANTVASDRFHGLAMAPSDQANPFTCTHVIGFSQTREWYLDSTTFEPIVGDAQWQLLWANGASIDLWADPNFSGWFQPIVSPCAQNSTNPDRVLLTIGWATCTTCDDPNLWAHYINLTIGNIRSKYPNVRQILLQPEVGGPNNGLCTFQGTVVKASSNHPYIDQAIALVVGGDVFAGDSPEVRTCADYVDNVGHFVDSAKGPIGANIGQFYVNMAPPPTPVPQTCPCTVWSTAATPSIDSVNDPNPVELGVKFRSDLDGFVSAIRFYKGPTNGGTHLGSLWTGSGALLGRATFTGETASGWQQVTFSTPIAISANTTYVASYFAPAGGYSADRSYFATNGTDRAPLHALSAGASGGDGVYAYEAATGFPTNSFNATNYWVDVVFNPSSPPTSTATSTPVATATRTTLPTNTPGLTSTPVPANCSCSTIFPSSATPANPANNDTNAVEVGVKFRADLNGLIFGIRFYKGGSNTGTHIGNLWTSTGTLLATTTFAGETTTGWQQMNFASPVAISANTTYVGSYHTNVGDYAADQNGLSNGADRAPLHALSSSSSGGNGVYLYGINSGFPVNTFNATNYWVDVAFATASAPTPTSTPASTLTVAFDDLANPNRSLTGQYPSGLIDWGGGSWYLSGSYGLFTTNSISFNGVGPTSASFSFVRSARLVQLDAYNGGTVTTTVALSCPGQATKTASLAANQLLTIATNWNGPCTTVTIASSNGWDTNVDNLVVQ
jgi:hypothetical protein